jgi:iron complex outermembrane receptor protein
MSTNPVRNYLRGALAAVIIVSLPALSAQDRVLEEVIVTGTKRAIAQQDTPISVSTLTANDIAKTFGNDIRAVGDLSPNVNLTLQTGFNAVAGGIRGTGSISILTTQDPSVGILIDEFALSHVQTQFVELFDLEQVEIYRGPQGTLFGKNSTGGVIAITSKRPDMEEFGGSVNVSTSSYGSDSNNHKIQVGFDVPLIPGELSIRFAGSQTEEDGFYFNDKDTATFPNSPLYAAYGVTPDQLPPELSLVTSGAGENLGGKDVFAAKTKALWQPNDNFEAYFIWEVVRDRSDSPAAVNETPGGEGFLFELLGFPGIQAAGHSDPFSTGMTQQGNGINIRDGHRVDVDGYYLNLTYSMENYTIKSITGFREQEETLPSTYTGEAFLSLYDATRNLEREQFQQEIRVISEFDGPLNFVAGGIYISDELDFRSYATVGLSSLFAGAPLLDDRGFLNLDLRGITGDPGGGQVKQDRESLAFYADGTYQFDDQWSLTMGVRHTKKTT